MHSTSREFRRRQSAQGNLQLPRIECKSLNTTKYKCINSLMFKTEFHIYIYALFIVSPRHLSRGTKTSDSFINFSKKVLYKGRKVLSVSITRYQDLTATFILYDILYVLHKITIYTTLSVN